MFVLQVTHCFAPIILEEVGATLGVRLLSFMILHRAEICQPVDGFRAKVEMIMKTHGIEAAFCKRITTSEYQAQKNAHLHQHMTQLLNNIVTDTAMDLKEKRKRLLLVNQTDKHIDICGEKIIYLYLNLPPLKKKQNSANFEQTSKILPRIQIFVLKKFCREFKTWV